jgi:hypothetical protein
MHKTSLYHTSLFILCWLFLSGCARMDVYSKKGVDYSLYRRAAVLPFTPPPEVAKDLAPGISEGVSDILGTQLLRSGWDVVERSRIIEVFKERELKLTEMPSGKKLEEVRTILGADLFVTGAITEWRAFEALKNDGAVGLTLKFYDAQTGELVYSGSGSRPIGLFDDKSQSWHAQQIVKVLCAKIPRRRN